MFTHYCNDCIVKEWCYEHGTCHRKMVNNSLRFDDGLNNNISDIKEPGTEMVEENYQHYIEDLKYNPDAND